jgi:hypothetical protein
MTSTPASRRASAFALIGLSATVLAAIGAIGLRIVNPAPVLHNSFGFGDLALVGFAVMGLAFASVGALLVLRRPTNAVGWLMVVVGISHAGTTLAAAATFSAAALGTTGGDRLAGAIGWLTLVLVMIGSFIFLLPFIYPTGRAHNRWWDRLVRVLIRFMALTVVVFAIQPGPLQIFDTIENPFAAGPDLRPLLGVSLSQVWAPASVLIAPAAILAIASRFRSSGQVERHQLKWFLFASSLSIVGMSIAAGGAAVTGGQVGEAGLAIFGFAGALIPVSIGIAILRHHLYNIDRLISRTIGYALVTAVLAAVFLTTNLGLQTVLAAATGGSTLVVAASTLLVAALFQPLRRAVQTPIDRRFNRAQIDGARMLAAFGERVRDEVDLLHLGGAVVATADEAVRPASTALWLRSSRR